MNPPDDEDTIPTGGAAFEAAFSQQAQSPLTQVSSWGAATTRGLARAHNEDAWKEYSSRLFVLADGMGGHEGGALAAHTAVRSLVSSAASGGITDWKQAVVRLNALVRTATRGRGFGRAGTTLVALAMEAGVATIIHTGDSRAYRARHGNLLQLTADHTAEAELSAAGIDLADQPDGSSKALTRYVGGADEHGVPDVATLIPFPGDRFLLATDGIHRQIDEATLASVIVGGECQDAANELVRLADAAGGNDNATAVVIAVEER